MTRANSKRRPWPSSSARQSDSTRPTRHATTSILYRGDREALAQSLTRVQQTASTILQAIDGDASRCRRAEWRGRNCMYLREHAGVPHAGRVYDCGIESWRRPCDVWRSRRTLDVGLPCPQLHVLPRCFASSRGPASDRLRPSGASPCSSSASAHWRSAFDCCSRCSGTAAPKPLTAVAARSSGRRPSSDGPRAEPPARRFPASSSGSVEVSSAPRLVRIDVASVRAISNVSVVGRWSLGPRRTGARLRPPAAPSKPPRRRAREPGHAGCGRRWPRAPRAPLLSSPGRVMVPDFSRRNQSRFPGGAEPCRPPSRPTRVTVKITANDKGNPPGKLADAELHFTDGPLAGLKLIGFAIWERRSGGGRNVTFPARQYSVNGERRSFALLRPVADSDGAGRPFATASSRRTPSTSRRSTADA